MFFIQMSGFPGSGKSTLSRQLAKHLDAVIVDHDVVKSSLMESIAEIPLNSREIGKVSYNVDWSLVEFHLSLGRNVILDSPCLYDEMIIRGTELASKYNVHYKYVECYLNDRKEINRRLSERKRMVSQILEVSSQDEFDSTVANSKKPENIKTLTVNTSHPLQTYLQDVINYIKS